MAVARWLLLTACTAHLLCSKNTALVAGFNPALGIVRSKQFMKRYSVVFSQSFSSESDSRQEERARLGAAGQSRARDIAAQARRRARDTSRQTRRDLRSPPDMRGSGEATSPTFAAPREQRVRPTMPSRSTSTLPRSQGDSRKSDNSRRDATPQQPTPTKDQGGGLNQDLNWMQQRVRDILDEYSSRAPPAEQWPPGRRIRVRGVEIYYKDTGSRCRGAARGTSKDRPNFVCLHGLGGSTASWDEVVTDLSEYGRVISFDRPGFGKTERVMPLNGLPWRLSPQTLGENPYSADFAAKVLFGLLDRLGVDKVILVAHSLGAQVALRAARTRPDMIRAMVLVAPAVLNPLDSRFVMGRDPNANLFTPILNLRTRVEMTARLAAFNMQLLQPGDTPLDMVRNITLNGDVEEQVQRNFHDRSLPSTRPELIFKYVEPLRDPLWDRGLLHFYKSLQGEIQPGEQLLQKTLDVWKGPSMIITGDNDPTVPTQSSVFVAETLEARLVVIETCAHIPMDEKSEVFTAAVLSFANSEEVRKAWVADSNANGTMSW
ncbi:unnamed protein product [Ascophyllum nodosum]